MYSPYDIVHTNDALRLLFVEHNGRLGDDPREATCSCQETVAVRFGLTFADYWKRDGGWIKLIGCHMKSIFMIRNCWSVYKCQ